MFHPSSVFRIAGFAATLALAIFANAPLQWLLRRVGRLHAADRLQIAIARLLCRALRLRVHVRGTVTPARPILIVANHVSWTDILAFGSVAPLCFIAKSDVADWPLLGWAVRAHGTLFVSRRRTKGIAQVNRLIAEAMAQGRAVVLFAEGTTGDGTRLEPFHSGHLAAAELLLAPLETASDVTLLPAAVAYTASGGLPAARLDRTALAWFGDMPLLPHVPYLLRRGPIRCDIVWGEPVAFRRGDDRKAAMRELRHRVHHIFSRLVGGQNPVNPAFGAVWSPAPIPAQTAADAAHETPI